MEYGVHKTMNYPLGSELAGPDESGLGGLGRGGGSLGRIFVPVDVAGRADAAVAQAARLSCEVGGVLRLVHVRIFDPPVRGSGRFFPQTADQASDVVYREIATAWAHGGQASGDVVTAPRTQVAAALVAAAQRWNAGVIVLARRPRRRVTRLLTGSVTDDVLRHASCPVMVIRCESC
jgi:nucleotide-binding universal stress UspA family protein